MAKSRDTKTLADLLLGGRPHISESWLEGRTLDMYTDLAVSQAREVLEGWSEEATRSLAERLTSVFATRKKKSRPVDSIDLLMDLYFGKKAQPIIRQVSF